jgi:ssDNA-binding Zn-finger/Zn-ribbon topoisomerase 1
VVDLSDEEKKLIEFYKTRWGEDLTKLCLYHCQCTKCEEIENSEQSNFKCKKCGEKQVLRRVEYSVDQVVRHIVRGCFVESFLKELERYRKVEQ